MTHADAGISGKHAPADAIYDNNDVGNGGQWWGIKEQGWFPLFPLSSLPWVLILVMKLQESRERGGGSHKESNGEMGDD